MMLSKQKSGLSTHCFPKVQQQEVRVVRPPSRAVGHTQVLTLLQPDQWQCARLSFQTVKNNGLVICSMWGYFAFFSSPGDGNGGSQSTALGPFDSRAAQILVPRHRPAGTNTLKTVLRAHSRAGAPECQAEDPQGLVALLSPGCQWDQFCIL